MKTVRVFYLRPTDVPFDQRFPDGIAAVVLEAQKYYLEQLGVTFQVNDPVVEVVDGDHDANWYTTTPGSDPNDDYWWPLEHAEGGSRGEVRSQSARLALEDHRRVQRRG